MTAFTDYYLVEVEKYLERPTTEEEKKGIMKLYVKGWHPRRTAEYIKTGVDNL
jgi:hypothetical protein